MLKQWKVLTKWLQYPLYIILEMFSFKVSVWIKNFSGLNLSNILLLKKQI